MPKLRSGSLYLALLLTVATTGSAARADLLVSNFGGFVVRYPDSALNQQYNFTTFPNTIVFPGTGGLSQAAGITMGPDGNFYVSNYDHGQILRFNGVTLAPDPQPFVTLPNDYNPATMQFDLTAAPAHLQFHDGGLYVSDNNGDKVYRYSITKNPATGVLTAGTTPTAAVSQLVGAGAFTFAANGDLYASSFAGPQYYDPPGQPPFVPAVVRVHNGVQSSFAFPVTDAMGNTVSPVSPQNPNGLLLVNNLLLVVDLSGNDILKYDTSGNYLGVFATIPPPAGVSPPPSNNFPSDLVLSRDGQSVLVAVLGYTQDPMTPPAGAVLKYDFSGNLVGTVASGLPIASSIALGVQRGDLDLDGSLTVADIRGEMVALSDLAAYATAHRLTGDEMAIVADVDGEGLSTNADLQVLINRLANAGQGSMNAVPEPSALLLASLGLLALLWMPRRKQF